MPHVYIVRIQLVVVCLVAMVVAYQNCSSGFGVNQYASELVEPLASPILVFSKAPPALTNQSSFAIEFKTSLDRRTQLASAKCQLDNKPAVDCSGGKFPMTDLTEGDHTVKINAVDSRGQRPDELVAIFRVDLSAPAIRLASQPAAVTGSATATFDFIIMDTWSDIAKVECSIDDASFGPCTSAVQHVAANLKEGARKFRVRAFDRAGNLSAELPYSWTIDLTAPILTIVKPANFINSNSISLSFSGSDNGQPITAFECQLDAGGFLPCTSPQPYSALSEGLRKFEVRGKDGAGNLSSPQSATFTVDTAKPSNPVITTALMSPTKVNRPQIAFSATDTSSGVAGYTCAVDSGGYTACSSPYIFPTALDDGPRILRVKARDLAGNESDPGNLPLTIDTTPPVVTILATQFPSSPTTEKNATIGFTANDANSTIKTTECALDSGSFAICTSPVPYTVNVGSHTVYVKATDAAGNAATVSKSWTVSAVATPTPAPTATATPPPDTGGDAFNFLVYGDSRAEQLKFEADCGGNQRHISLVKLMAKEPASFVVHVGDIVAGHVGAVTNWVEEGDCKGADRTGSLKQIIAPLTSRPAPAGLSSFFIPVIGNHDDGWNEGGYPDKFGGGFCDVFSSVLNMIPNHTQKPYFAGTFTTPNGGRMTDADFYLKACSKTDPSVYPTYFYFSYNLKNTHFIVLRVNTDIYDLEENGDACKTTPHNYDKCYYMHQLDWLRDDLAKAKADTNVKNIFVFLHAPLFTNSDGHSNNASSTTLRTLFSEAKVKIVFSGHNHVYERSYPIATSAANPGGVRDDANGVVYTVTGGGGSGFHGFRGGDNRFAKQTAETHYLKVNVSGTAVSVKAIRNDGVVIDSYTR